MIGDNIEIKILKIEGTHVQLGISAPREVPVHRREIYEAIHSSNRASSDISITDLTKAVRALDKKKKDS